MQTYHLAQISIARMVAPIDDPLLAEFVAQLVPINALADHAPGFVWRFQTPAGDATSVRPYDDQLIIINFSVWESVEALRAFVYKSAHADIMRMRRQWFEKMGEQHMALWWVRAGHIPTWQDAKERLEAVRQHGDTPFAFTFRRIFATDNINSADEVVSALTPSLA